MSCPYYWWNHHYACRKSGKDVNEDTYDKYCKNYDYDDCPIYKGQESSGGCFLTSACVEAKGLADDCYELTVLRSFRDTYLRTLPEGPAEIVTYYFIAPQIVESIRKTDYANTVFDSIYNTIVAPCVRYIENGENEKAHQLYRQETKKLWEKYKP